MIDKILKELVYGDMASLD